MKLDAVITEQSFRPLGAGRSLSPAFGAEMLERVDQPIVVAFDDGEVQLNAQARSLWPTLKSDSPKLPVLLRGESWSLLSVADSTGGGPDMMVGQTVRAPGGEEYAVHSFSGEHLAGSTVSQAILLRPVRQGPPDGVFVNDKVNRLKAIVHECRNALTAAREAVSIVREEALGELNADQQRFLSSAADDLDALVRAMVDITSLWATQAGVLRLIARPVDMQRVLEQTTLSVQSVAALRGIALHVSIDEPAPDLTGDHELLIQAVRNVLTNALRHTPPGGNVWVRAFVVQGHDESPVNGPDSGAEPQPGVFGGEECVVLEVEDSGPGIAPSDYERVFQPFERGSSGRADDGTPGTGGMGLGLTIARNIATTHGGTLTVRSAPSGGSCFVFRFPKSQSSARSWRLRSLRRAIEEVRPLSAPVAAVLLRFEIDDRDQLESAHPDLSSTIQQVAIKALRGNDTVLAVEGQLLLLIRGSTRSAAYALVDRVLESLAEMFRDLGATLGEFRVMFGVAAYPDDGDDAEAVLNRVEAELGAFETCFGAETDEPGE